LRGSDERDEPAAGETDSVVVAVADLDGAPAGPSELEETAFLATQRELDPGPVAAPVVAGIGAAAEPDAPLPPLEDLVQRIPAPTRELMDSLFRANFIGVKRLPASAFKT